MDAKRYLMVMAAAAIAFASVSLGCQKVKQGASSAYSTAKGIVRPGNMLVVLDGPSGTVLEVTHGRFKDPETEETKSVFHLPAEALLNVPSENKVQIYNSKSKVYAKVEVLKSTDYTEVTKMNLPLGSSTLHKASQGQTQIVTVQDPYTDEVVIKVTIGNRFEE